MNMIELIELKKHQKELTAEQIHYIVDGYTHDLIPDYQMSAFMMAIYFNSLTKKETSILTLEMAHSGHMIDLSSIDGIKVDKHSTGGVGDKTTLVLAPMVASLGVKVAKMSGRGLGHTGGTIDKLEAIPGYKVEVDEKDFIEQVKDINLAVVGQSDVLVPADKKMYALRDVTGCVDSIPLIASSIMSKKIASGANAILLDVKFGDGAFMNSKEDAIKLAKEMISIGKQLDIDTRASISTMDQPLGNAIGNSLEVIEAIETLQGHGPEDLESLCLQDGAVMLMQANKFDSLEEAQVALKESLHNGTALNKFIEMVEYQGGDSSYIKNPDKFTKTKYQLEVKAKEVGYVHLMHTKELGLIAMDLGGGRKEKTDIIDHSVGLVLNKKIGDRVEEDETLLTIYSNKEISKEIISRVYASYVIKKDKCPKLEIIEEMIKG